MHLELQVTNERRVLPSVQAFLHSTLLQLPLPTNALEQLEQLASAAVEHAVENAYPSGEEGSIKLSIHVSADKLEICVRDFGLPQDVQRLERQLHEKDATAGGLHGMQTAEAIDEIHWLAFGPEGKALQLIQWLHQTNIAATAAAADLAPIAKDVPLAPPQPYKVRRMLPDEAVQVSQLMYKTYGNTYFNEDVYYPERIAAQNAHGVLISFVAVGDGDVLNGHCALECNQPGPIAELGQAAVDPAHRGRGLLERMKEGLEREAAAMGLVGWYADAVTVHTYTQQSNAHHGGHVCGVDLAVSPKNEAFRNIADRQSQRVSCIIYFHWLHTPQSRTVFVPARHRAIVAAIYENLQCPVEFGMPASPSEKHGRFAVKLDQRAALATIRAELLGEDSTLAIRHAVRSLVEVSRAEVVVVELPLTQPAAVEVCESLENAGLAITGIGPLFWPSGDVLKLAYLVEPLARAPIMSFESFADRVVEYALAEQQRVRSAL